MADAQGAAVIPVYPIYLTGLDQLLTVVVGGGAIGERKIQALLAGSAHVRLISPQATPQLQAWAAAGQIDWQQRPYQHGDLAGAFLAFATTDQRSINTQVAAEARDLRILCNVADRAEEGNFHTPATHRQADIVIAVGSTGKNPRRVKQLRDWIAKLCEDFDIIPKKG